MCKMDVKMFVFLGPNNLSSLHKNCLMSRVELETETISVSVLVSLDTDRA